MIRVARYGIAWLRRGYWRLRGWETLVPPDVQDARLAICALCEHNRDGTCALCGCPVEAKTAWASEESPAGYWDRQKIPR